MEFKKGFKIPKKIDSANVVLVGRKTSPSVQKLHLYATSKQLLCATHERHYMEDSEGGARSESPCGDQGSAAEDEGGAESSWRKA